MRETTARKGGDWMKLVLIVSLGLLLGGVLLMRRGAQTAEAPAEAVAR